MPAEITEVDCRLQERGDGHRHLGASKTLDRLEDLLLGELVVTDDGSKDTDGDQEDRGQGEDRSVGHRRRHPVDATNAILIDSSGEDVIGESRA